MNDDLKRSIIQTLAFFDLFDMPLTDEEVFRYLYRPPQTDFSQIQQTLYVMGLQDITKKHDGHWFLADREPSIVQQRQDARKRSHKLLDKSMHWISALASWPGVEGIAICNTLAWYNASEKSDVDLFIITKPGQIWQTRFALSAFLHAFDKRPRPDKEYGTICLSFFITSDQLDLDEIAHEDDIYLSYWIASLLPAYDPKGLFIRFKEANEQLSSVAGWRHPERRPINHAIWLGGRALTSPSNLAKTFLERQLRAFQHKRFPLPLRQAEQKQDKSVIISEKIIKLHATDRRIHYREAWKRRSAQFPT